MQNHQPEDKTNTLGSKKEKNILASIENASIMFMYNAPDKNDFYALTKSKVESWLD